MTDAREHDLEAALDEAESDIVALLKALRIAIADSCGGCGDDECVPCQTLERAGVAS